MGTVADAKRACVFVWQCVCVVWLRTLVKSTLSEYWRAFASNTRMMSERQQNTASTLQWVTSGLLGQQKYPQDQ